MDTETRRLLDPHDDALAPPEAVDRVERWLNGGFERRLDAGDVPEPLVELTRRADDQRTKGRDEVLESGPLQLMKQFKQRLIAATEELAREEAEIRDDAHEFSPKGLRKRLDDLRERRDEAIRREVERYREHEERLLDRFGHDSLPEDPMSADSANRARVALAQAEQLSDEGLARLVLDHASKGDRATLNALRPIVEERASHAGPLEEGHPLKDARRALRIGNLNSQVFAAAAAREVAAEMRSQAELLARVVSDRGKWSGPAATMTPRAAPDFPLVTEEEHRIHGEGS